MTGLFQKIGIFLLSCPLSVILELLGRRGDSCLVFLEVMEALLSLGVSLKATRILGGTEWWVVGFEADFRVPSFC